MTLTEFSSFLRISSRRLCRRVAELVALTRPIADLNWTRITAAKARTMQKMIDRIVAEYFTLSFNCSFFHQIAV